MSALRDWLSDPANMRPQRSPWRASASLETLVRQMMGPRRGRPEKIGPIDVPLVPTLSFPSDPVPEIDERIRQYAAGLPPSIAASCAALADAVQAAEAVRAGECALVALQALESLVNIHVMPSAQSARKLSTSGKKGGSKRGGEK